LSKKTTVARGSREKKENKEKSKTIEIHKWSEVQGLQVA
jgi:hypothetical protein